MLYCRRICSTQKFRTPTTVLQTNDHFTTKDAFFCKYKTSYDLLTAIQNTNLHMTVLTTVYTQATIILDMG